MKIRFHFQWPEECWIIFAIIGLIMIFLSGLFPPFLFIGPAFIIIPAFWQYTPRI